MNRQLELKQLVKRQNSLITRRQALAAGVHPDVLHRRTRPGGPWQRILPGVYLTVTGTATRDQRQLAALLYSGPSATLTGQAALARHGMRADPRFADVLIPADRQRKSVGFVIVHRTTRLPPYVCYQGPVQFALPARAVADAVRAMRELADVRAVVAAAVQSKRCTIDQLAVELQDGPARGSALFRAALAEVAQGARSGPEGELLALIRRARLPEPWPNALLFAGDEPIARPDAWWPDFGVAVEVDSKEWHLAPKDWEQTMRRHARMTALGILVLHFSPRQIREEPEEVLATIRTAIDGRRGQQAPQVRTLAA
jgi:hypothetical protein